MGVSAAGQIFQDRIKDENFCKRHGNRGRKELGTGYSTISKSKHFWRKSWITDELGELLPNMGTVHEIAFLFCLLSHQMTKLYCSADANSICIPSHHRMFLEYIRRHENSKLSSCSTLRMMDRPVFKVISTLLIHLYCFFKS